MSNSEIIVIDDDIEDCEFFEIAISELKITNPIRIFNDGSDALEHLQQTSKIPFLIICDINMPGINGLELKELMNSNPASQIDTVPFVFLTTAATPTTYRFAQSLNIQGYFEKPTSMEKLKDILFKIVNYWNSVYSAGYMHNVSNHTGYKNQNRRTA